MMTGCVIPSIRRKKTATVRHDAGSGTAAATTPREHLIARATRLNPVVIRGRLKTTATASAAPGCAWTPISTALKGASLLGGLACIQGSEQGRARRPHLLGVRALRLVYFTIARETSSE